MHDSAVTIFNLVLCFGKRDLPRVGRRRYLRTACLCCFALNKYLQYLPEARKVDALGIFQYRRPAGGSLLVS